MRRGSKGVGPLEERESGWEKIIAKEKEKKGELEKSGKKPSTFSRFFWVGKATTQLFSSFSCFVASVEPPLFYPFFSHAHPHGSLATS